MRGTVIKNAQFSAVFLKICHFATKRTAEFVENAPLQNAAFVVQ